MTPHHFSTGRLGRVILFGGLCGLIFLGGTLSPRAAEPAPEDVIGQAKTAYRTGRKTEALLLLNKAVAAQPKDSSAYFLRARIFEEQQRHADAIDDYTHFIALDPKAALVYHLRGAEHFKLGHLAESLADFDKAIQLNPSAEPQNWQRGITQYYAGRYDDGRRQFELHRTVNAQDVENAVWHYLCVARLSGVEKARAALIPIAHDGRIPMMKIHELYAGKARPEDVFAAAAAGNPPADQLAEQTFYAHLYVGLWYEAAGNAAKTREHLLKAADFKGADYMHDVARVHAGLLRARKP